MKISKNKKGFTLIEVVAAIGIITVLIVGTYTFLLSYQKEEVNSSKRLYLASEMNGVVETFYNINNIDIFSDLKDNGEVLIGADNIVDIIYAIQNNIILGSNFYKSSSLIKYVLIINTKELSDLNKNLNGNLFKSNLFGIKLNLIELNNPINSNNFDSVKKYAFENGTSNIQNLIVRVDNSGSDNDD